MALRVGRVHDGKFLSCASICDSDGWIDAKEYWPADFSLVSVLIDGKAIPYNGWITFGRWDGLHIRDKHKVTHWKPLPTSEANIKKHLKKVEKRDREISEKNKLYK